MPVYVLPNHSWCVPEDGGSKALGDADQTGPIHLHDLVIHLYPDADKDEGVILCPQICLYMWAECDTDIARK